MARRARKVCSSPGCPQLSLVGMSKCEEHEQASRQAADARRPTAHERGYTARWHAASKRYLADHPYCADGCGGRASVVDHIMPHKGDQALFWDEANWQGLTKAHHDRKTAKENGGYGNAMRHNRGIRNVG